MLLDALLFVSKRLQAIAAALICLAFAQLALAGTAPQAARAESAHPQAIWRVHIQPN